MPVATYTKAGLKSSSPAKLDKKVFGVEVKDHNLLKLAYNSYLAEARNATPKAKTRGDVRGGGAKPRPQKGTGRARFGSTRNPIWVGGGVAFGPTGNENHRLKITKRSKHVALRQALSLASQSEKLIIIDDFTSSSGKTRDAAKLLTKIAASGRILIVVDTQDEKLRQALGNLADVKLARANYLTTFDILNADKIVLSKGALDHISKWLGGPNA